MPEESQSVSLKTLFSGVLQALMEAKQLGDTESAKLLTIYKEQKTLSSFSVPAFTISDVDLDLRFSIVDLVEGQGEGELLDIKVNVSSESLKELQDHQISRMTFKISPVNLRVFEKSEGV